MCLYLRMRVLSEETDLNVAHEPPRRATPRKTLHSKTLVSAAPPLGTNSLTVAEREDAPGVYWLAMRVRRRATQDAPPSGRNGEAQKRPAPLNGETAINSI